MAHSIQSNKVSSVLISSVQADQRIDNFLFCYVKGVPKSRLYRAIRAGEVRVNKRRVKANYRLKVGDFIRIPPLRVGVKSPVRTPSRSLLLAIEENIIYEDKDLIILNKPAGLAVHGGSGLDFGVIEILRYARPKLSRLGLVHRLDRDTSGCLMIAKKPSILKELQSLFVLKSIKKIYLAVVYGSWQGGERLCEAPLKKNILSSGERIVKVSQEGKSASTLFRPLKRWKNKTLLEVRPFTGRTHQIRVHAVAMGHPIVGDKKYAPKALLQSSSTRLFLHAAELGFCLPGTGQGLAVCACLDETFRAMMA